MSIRGLAHPLPALVKVGSVQSAATFELPVPKLLR